MSLVATELCGSEVQTEDHIPVSLEEKRPGRVTSASHVRLKEEEEVKKKKEAQEVASSMCGCTTRGNFN
ncbi:hypothetical protein CEXT_344111 [Caerostris extrusa]|uniref:Uncharacterized protein n=1 Tax=Caerostris extrusa TaxID=172846 RepID=A0AAV4Y7G8_CAEEX|nr:hypothetical protein CEXT_344111 [Caerostris extrusa]